MTTLLQLPYHVTQCFSATIISQDSTLFHDMSLKFLRDLPTAADLCICQMHCTPMLHLTYTSANVQTYVQTTRHALHVATQQHNLLQWTDPVTSQCSIPSIQKKKL